MTAQGAEPQPDDQLDFQPDDEAEPEVDTRGSVWHAIRTLPGRTSLRTKLVATVLALVIVALATIGIVSVSLLRGYLLHPADSELEFPGLPTTVQNAISVDPRSQEALAQAGFYVYWLPNSGVPQVIVRPAQVYGESQDILPASSLTSIGSWLSANQSVPITVPGQSGGDRWRVISLGALTINGVSGTLVAGLDVSGAYATLGRLTGLDIIISVVIVFVLAVVGFALVRANLRPLVEIEETAEEIAEGHLERRVPERDPHTEIGRLGRSLNTMLSQIESAFHAREESEAAAHQSEERMRRFIADASHELRTPLTAIRGFAEYYRQRGGLVQQWDDDEAPVASNSGLSAEDLDRIMHRVEAEAARMGLLVEDLLLLARMDQQRPLARKPVDLLTLAADAVHDTRMVAPNRTIDLKVQPGAAFLVVGDEPRLRQVIGNLMSNALTHTPEGTPIEVSIKSGKLDPRAEIPQPAVILDIRDHGPGMSPEQAHRVFERFYRADQARTRATGGSGLGLAIVAALVSAHGGVTSVRTAPGRGATFRVALPLDPEAEGSGDEEPLSDDDEPAIDDDEPAIDPGVSAETR